MIKYMIDREWQYFRLLYQFKALPLTLKKISFLPNLTSLLEGYKHHLLLFVHKFKKLAATPLKESIATLKYVLVFLF